MYRTAFGRHALRAFRKGDFTARLPMDLDGVDGEIAETFNDVVELNQQMMKELARPELKVLYTSAHGDELAAEHGADALRPLLEKPYRDHDLARAVRDALG